MSSYEDKETTNKTINPFQSDPNVYEDYAGENRQRSDRRGDGDNDNHYYYNYGMNDNTQRQNHGHDSEDMLGGRIDRGNMAPPNDNNSLFHHPYHEQQEQDMAMATTISHEFIPPPPNLPPPPPPVSTMEQQSELLDITYSNTAYMGENIDYQSGKTSGDNNLIVEPKLNSNNSDIVISETPSQSQTKRTKKKKKKRAKTSNNLGTKEKQCHTSHRANTYQIEYNVATNESHSTVSLHSNHRYSIENYDTPPTEKTSFLPKLFSSPVLNNVNRGSNINRLGLQNSAHGPGTTLHELSQRMRIVNLLTCIATLFLEGFSLLGNALTLHPSRLIMGVYLSFFSVLVFGYELHNQRVAAFIRDNFGILYSWVGRGVVLVLMGGLSFGQGNLIMWILGLFISCNGILTIYFGCRFRGLDEVYSSEGYASNGSSDDLVKGPEYSWSALAANAV